MSKRPTDLTWQDEHSSSYLLRTEIFDRLEDTFGKVEGNQMTDFYTADNHFGHTNIIKYCSRPFDNVDEMNKRMIENWNSVVTDNDIVWHVGDFTLGALYWFSHFATQLNAKQINFIPGNHDRRWMRRLDIYHPRYKIMDQIVYQKDINVVLCHYPMLTWPRSHYGVLHLHGHCHGTVGKVGRSGDASWRVDVGVDCWDYYPVTMEQIQERIEEYK